MTVPRKSSQIEYEWSGNKKERGRGKGYYAFGVDGDAERRVEGGGNCGDGGVLWPERDVAHLIPVDADTGYGAVDLESGLEIENRTVWRQAHHDQSWRRGRLRDRRVIIWNGEGGWVRRRAGKRAAALGHGAGEVAGGVGGFISLAGHGRTWRSEALSQKLGRIAGCSKTEREAVDSRFQDHTWKTCPQKEKYLKWSNY